MKQLFASLLLVVILFQIAGCASPTLAPTQTPVPSNTPIPIPIATPVPTATLEPTPIVSEATIQKIDDLLTVMNVEQKTFYGIALVAYQNQLVLNKAYGMKDREENVPFTTDTLMLLGDVGLINSGILLLNDQGKLPMDNSICLYISDCPDAWQPITVNDVLHQRSGLPSPYVRLNTKEIDELWSRPDRDDAILNVIREKPLDEIPSPGTAAISPSNQTVKIKIIEAASGKTAQDFLVGELLEPLGITSIGKNYPASSLPKGYTEYGGLPVENDFLPAEMTFPDFVVGTTSDLYLLFQEYIAPKILSKEAVEQLWEEDVIYFPVDKAQFSINLLGVTRTIYSSIPNGIGAWDKWSFTEGYGFSYFVSKQNQMIVIMSTNRENQDYTMVIKIIMEWLMD